MVRGEKLVGFTPARRQGRRTAVQTGILSPQKLAWLGKKLLYLGTIKTLVIAS
jgi:hypothetical protein